jgi:putative MATE family efflux protein
MAETKDMLLQRIRNGGALSTGAQIRLCLMLSYPAILAQLSSVMMQYIDTSMVGHLGAAQGASIGLVSTCLWLWGGFCFAASTGFSVQVAHLIGANDFKSARAVLRQALTVAMSFSTVLAIIGASISQVLPHWLGGGPDIVGDAGKYFLIMALFMPAMQLDWMCAAMLQATGNMKVPSLLSIGMCVLDVVFNYLFIYKLEMGVVGAALGSGLAEVITAIAMFSFLAFKSPEMRLTQEKGSFRPTEKVVRKGLRIGGPMAFQNLLLRGGYIAATVIVAPLGTIAIAANTFAITAESLCYMPGAGIADASTSLVGQSIGAGRKELAKRFAWITAALGMSIMGFLAILMYIFAPQMMGLLSPDAEVIGLGARVLRIEAFAEVGYAASMVIYGSCVGAGDTKVPSVMNFGSMWIVRILPAIFITPVYGLVGFWVCMAVDLSFRGVLFLIRLYRGTWLKNVQDIL